MAPKSGYSSAIAVNDAIAQVVKEASDQGEDGNRVLSQLIFERFLSRVFSGATENLWMLAGGTSMLARVATSRATKDIDLIRTDSAVEFAERELVNMAKQDLGDFVSFDYLGKQESLKGDAQPYAQGVVLRFNVRIGAKKYLPIKVDLVVRPVITGIPTVSFPANQVTLGKPLTSYPYLLFPIVDQVADKVCASQQKYSGGVASSRQKDLVDLVVIACTQSMGARELTHAIRREASLRNMGILRQVRFPNDWAGYYRTEAQKNPILSDVQEFESALDLVESWLTPILRGTEDESEWDFTARVWVPVTASN